MPSPSCSYCQQDNLKNESFPIDVGAADCISCNCSSNTGINCQYLNQPLCQGDLSCGLDLLTYASCKICIDPVDGSHKQDSGTWKTSDGIHCSCVDGKTHCVKPVVVGDIFLIIDCAQCTPQKYQKTFHQPRGIHCSIFIFCN